jgi:hypothetical protein
MATNSKELKHVSAWIGDGREMVCLVPSRSSDGRLRLATPMLEGLLLLAWLTSLDRTQTPLLMLIEQAENLPYGPNQRQKGQNHQRRKFRVEH